MNISYLKYEMNKGLSPNHPPWMWIFAKINVHTPFTFAQNEWMNVANKRILFETTN